MGKILFLNTVEDDLIPKLFFYIHNNSITVSHSTLVDRIIFRALFIVC